MQPLIVIATYPRSMSAWLANFLTIPNHSMYVHDGLFFTRVQKYLEDYEYRGIVSPSTDPDLLPDCKLIVIDNDFQRVQRSVNAWLGDASTLPVVYERMEHLKQGADLIFHFDDMQDWIAYLFETCTGQKMDWNYYKALREFYIEGMVAKTKGAELRELNVLLTSGK